MAAGGLGQMAVAVGFWASGKSRWLQSSHPSSQAPRRRVLRADLRPTVGPGGPRQAPRACKRKFGRRGHLVPPRRPTPSAAPP